MKTVWRILDRLLRGPRTNRWLQRFGINPVHYWILIDLFSALSERREVFSQLGRDGMSLRKASLLYLVFSALMVLPFLAIRLPVASYFLLFQAITAFVLLSMLLPETSNSLVNPVEGLVLAHQPIDGATYTAAKLTHLVRIVCYLVPGIALIPALAGLTQKYAPWYYPLLHLASALTLGLVLALLCCAVFGWLLRLVAPARLKAVGFVAEMSPWIVYVGFQAASQFKAKVRLRGMASLHGTPAVALAAGLAIGAVLAVVFGIRALSGDYLARVAAIAQGGSGAKSKPRRAIFGALAAWWLGGPTVLAGYEYVSRMMRRDWQFRRQLLPLIPITVMPLAAGLRDLRHSPFTSGFSWMHLFPHALGLAFYLICTVMVYGNDHKGAWLFLLAPAGAFRGFARGVWSRLMALVVMLHIALLVALAWMWGIRDASLFTIYSVAATSLYIGLEIRLIDGVPFAKQPEAVTNPFAFIVLAGGGLVISVIVAIQYFVIFHSAAAVMVTSVVIGVVSWLITRGSFDTLETNMRFHLGILSTEAKAIYTEIN